MARRCLPGRLLEDVPSGRVVWGLEGGDSFPLNLTFSPEEKGLGPRDATTDLEPMLRAETEFVSPAGVTVGGIW